MLQDSNVNFVENHLERRKSWAHSSQHIGDWLQFLRQGKSYPICLFRICLRSLSYSTICQCCTQVVFPRLLTQVGGDSNFDSGARIAWSATDMTEAFTTTHGLDDSSKRRLKNLSLETENTQLYLKPCRGIIANASLTNLWNLSFNKKWTSKSFIFQQYCITRLNCFSSLFGQIWVKVQCCSVTQTKSCQFFFSTIRCCTFVKLCFELSAPVGLTGF